MRQPRPPQEDICKPKCHFVPDGYHHFRADVRVFPVERFAKPGALGDEIEHGGHFRAVGPEQMEERGPRQPELARAGAQGRQRHVQPCGSVQRKRPRARRHPADPAGRRVDDVLGHPPVGRELAADDRVKPLRRPHHRMPAGQARAGDGSGADQRPQAGVRADDVAGRERKGEEAGRVRQQIRDITRRHVRIVRRAVPLGIGRPHHQHTLPGDDERDPPVIGLRQHERGPPHPQAGGGKDDVHALGAPDAKWRRAGEAGDVLRPQPGRVDRRRRPHGEALSGAAVDETRARDPSGLGRHPDGLHIVGDDGPPLRGRPQDGEREPRVVGQAVVVEKRPAEAVHAQRGDERGRGGGIETPVAGPPAAAGQNIVRPQAERHPQGQGGAQGGGKAQPEGARGAPVQRQHKRQGPDQMGRVAQEDVLLLQAFPYLGEIEHRQVAKASVDELGRPAAGPLREVTAFDQSGREPAGGRLEDHTGPGDPAADHQHIERAAAQPGEVRGADHHAIPASRSAVPSSTAAPRTQSSLGVHSASLWLRPPALGTKIMPAGCRSATYLASWPAPAHKRWVE